MTDAGSRLEHWPLDNWRLDASQCLIWPNGGSTIALRRAYSVRPPEPKVTGSNPVAVNPPDARWRLLRIEKCSMS